MTGKQAKNRQRGLWGLCVPDIPQPSLNGGSEGGGGVGVGWGGQQLVHNNNYHNNNNTLYSSQREIKAVSQSYTLTQNKELNCTYLNNSKLWNAHVYTLLDIHPLSLNQYMLKQLSNANT